MIVAWALLLALGLAGCLTFVAIYWWAARGWYESPVGRNLMAMALVLGGMLALSLAAIVWAPPDWLFLGGLASLDAVMWWRVVLLWQVTHNNT